MPNPGPARCRARARILFAGVLSWSLLCLPGFTRAGGDPPAIPGTAGVVVEETYRNSAGEKAGLQPGDVILAWERLEDPSIPSAPAAGTVSSPEDWSLLEWEQAPRGPVRLRIERAGKPLECLVPPGIWRTTVRPALPDSLLAVYLDGRSKVDAGRTGEGLAAWQQLAEEVELADEAGLSAWIASCTAGALVKERQWDAAEAVVRRALGTAPLAGDPLAGGWLLFQFGQSYYRQNQSDRSEAAFLAAHDVFEQVAPGSLAAGQCLYWSGIAASLAGNFRKMEDYYSRALRIRETLAPGSYDTMMCLWDLGISASRRSDRARANAWLELALSVMERLIPDSREMARLLNTMSSNQAGFNLDQSERIGRRALDIARKAAPGGLEESAALNNLGVLAYYRLEYEQAETAFRQRLAILEKSAPGGQEHAMALQAIGILYQSKGELERAEDCFTRSLAILDKMSPDSYSVAHALNSMGMVFYAEWELDRAQQCLDRAQAILEKVAPASGVMEINQGLQGNVALLRAIMRGRAELNVKNGLGAVRRPEELDRAERFFQQALEIREKLSPDRASTLAHLGNLGQIAYLRGDLARAGELFNQVIQTQEQLQPGSYSGWALSLALTFYLQGDLEKAEKLFREYIARTQAVAPDTSSLPEYCLALVYRKENRLGLAWEWLQKSLESLEKSEKEVPAETVALIRAIQPYYYTGMELCLQDDRPADAFQVMERFRGRQFLQMLSERDLLFRADIPGELARLRLRSIREYNQLQQELMKISPERQGEQFQGKSARLQELRQTLDQVNDRIRLAAPRLAALRRPVPLDAGAARAMLDPGTVLLAYALGEERSVLFAVNQAEGLRVLDLGLGRDELEHLAEGFRREIFKARTGNLDPAGVAERGRRLYDLLVRPAEGMIGPAERILIVPDRFLQTLPFSALVRTEPGRPVRTSGRRDWRWLAEWKPVHVALSATVFAELKKARPAGGPGKRAPLVKAFGNPEYPAPPGEGTVRATAPSVRAALRGFDLQPLPYTEAEVKGIAAIYRDQAETFLGNRATEEQFKSVTGEARIFHFACHGLLNEACPLDTALALTIPAQPAEEQEDGLLQAWEILESVRLRADLVVLSACETALGGEMGGEGLIGLTRAFQYAGARSVLASLWSIADASTAALMGRFYEYLEKGLSKDEALRRAQVDLIRRPVRFTDEAGRRREFDASHPFFWAAFQLNGDWR